MDKILVIGSFPAPYRVAVFKGLLKRYDADIFFVSCKDEKRDDRFFVGTNTVQYYLLNQENGKQYFFEKLRNISEYKIVVAYDWYLFYAMLAELFALWKNIPYVINCDGALKKKYQTFRIKDIIKKFFVRHASLCFASGKHAEEYFIHYGASTTKIVKHNFTSLERTDVISGVISKKEREKCRRELAFDDKKIILSVGQFIYRKGYDLLLEAWKELDSEFRLIIIGGGPEANNYESFIKEHGLKQVNLIEYLPHEEILKYMRAADLFVLPTREDIWGLVVNEAMANGVPVITTDQCVAGKELLDIDCICPIDKFTIRFPQMVRKMFNDPEKIEIIRQENYDKIKKYTYDEIIQSHISMLERL